jgi:regulator of sigma E protease
LAPIIDEVMPTSIAERSGLKAQEEIVAFAGKPIASWRDFQYALMPFLGSNEIVPMTVKLPKTASQKQVHLSLEHWTLDTESPDVLKSLGIKPFIPTVPPVIGEVVRPSPAYSSGLQQQDVIMTMNHQPLSDWLVLVEFVKQHPKTVLKLRIRRQGQLHDVVVRIGEIEQEGSKQGFLGLRSQTAKWPEHWLRIQRLSPIQAARTAFTETVDLTVATFKLIGRFVTGKLSVKSISGPVGIAQGAGDSARNGLAHYLAFLALISISLGVLNVLPIPMLDGGHLLYYLIEWISRRPLSEGAKARGMYFGMVLLVVLMLIALGNDVSRLLG